MPHPHDLPDTTDYFLARLRTLAATIRDAVRAGIAGSTTTQLAAAVDYRGGDTIYGVDTHAEDALLSFCATWSREMSFLLVAEGLEGGRKRFPEESATPAFTLIVDPVDGSRGLMYGKRSAWVLCAIAPPPRDGHEPTLTDIAVAVQAEIPTPRAALADTLWAVAGEGVEGVTEDLRTGETVPMTPRPSEATTLAGGFAAVVKYLPGTKRAAVDLEERLFAVLLGKPGEGAPPVFDDEYISCAGQLYGLMTGQDRFIADLRPVLSDPDGTRAPLASHPYDLCTWIIAQGAGVIVTDEKGETLRAPLDVESPVTWVGYANETLRASIEPILQRLLEEYT